MAWQDRHYYRDQGASSNPLLWLLNGSIPLFTAFGIRVRMHVSLLILLVLTLVTASTSAGIGVQNAITGSIILFGIILVHEFGHCFAARSVGGDANEILMWPLGGLAYADAPNRAWPQLVTAAGGPLVNVVICLITAAVLLVINWHAGDLTWNPLSHKFHIPYGNPVAYYLWWIFIVSWALLLFNLVPIFPLDGGRIFQTLLWFKLGYYRATMIATVVGMAGSVVLAVFGLTQLGSWSGLLLICIGVSCFMYCFQLRAQLKAAGPWEFQDDSGPDYSASLWSSDEDKPRRSRKLSRRAVRKLRKQQQDEEAEQAQIDAILAKVSAHGMHSLTWSEKRALRKATERQRRREVELSRDRAGA